MTDAQIVEAFGGYQALAKLLDMPVNTVWHWKTRGIPYRYRYKVACLADSSGIALGYDFLEARA